MRRRPWSLDRFVDSSKKSRWKREAQAPCRLEVEDELEADRLQDRHVSRFRPLEDLPDVAASLAVHPPDVWVRSSSAGPPLRTGA